MRDLGTWAMAAVLAAAGAGVAAAAENDSAPRKADPDSSAARLVAAAKAGDTEAIGRLLAGGVPPDAKGAGQVTALFVASLYGRTGAARLLLEKGADPAAAKGRDGSTALHAAAFLCHEDTVRLLLDRGAEVNALNDRSETPLDTVSGPWSDSLAKFYAGVAKALGVRLDLEKIRRDRPRLARLLRARGGWTVSRPRSTGPQRPGDGDFQAVAALGLRCSYYKNGRIYVNVLGTPEGRPLTVPPGKGWEDFKPSWSKTGDLLVFFRRVRNDPVVTNWRTAVCVIRTDGSGFHRLSDGTHTDFNPTWTRDGTNRPIWNRKNDRTGGFIVMAGKVGARPGEEVALSDPRYHTWAYTCLADGRILVQCAHPKQGWGYYLMTPNVGGESRYERIDCPLAKVGLLDRISLSPSEKKVCFEHQVGFKYRDPGRTLFIADFDAKKRTITNARPIANRDRRPIWFAYPRWVKGETAVVYHSYQTGRGGLYLYTLADGRTRRASVDPAGDYRYPHGAGQPK